MHSNLNTSLFRWKRAWTIFLLSFILLGVNNSCSKTSVDNAKEKKAMKSQIPKSINAEHEELHLALEKAIESGGKTGEAAKVVAERMHLHFKNEEEYALPQLGLLNQLAEGKVYGEMKEAIKLSDKLKADLPQMLAEHKTIVAALDNLSNAAKSENKTDVIEFTEKLKMHAQNEEEVLYPAAILVGEYLKLRLKE